MKIRYGQYQPQAWVLHACDLCGKYDVELCNDCVCRSCHKSLTFEDCVSGRWTARMRAQLGLPPEAP